MTLSVEKDKGEISIKTVIRVWARRRSDIRQVIFFMVVPFDQPARLDWSKGDSFLVKQFVLYDVCGDTAKVAHQGQTADPLYVPEKVDLFQAHGSHTCCRADNQD